MTPPVRKHMRPLSTWCGCCMDACQVLISQLLCAVLELSNDSLNALSHCRAMPMEGQSCPSKFA
jgi:hypothetical protein